MTARHLGSISAGLWVLVLGLGVLRLRLGRSAGASGRSPTGPVGVQGRATGSWRRRGTRRLVGSALLIVVACSLTTGLLALRQGITESSQLHALARQGAVVTADARITSDPRVLPAVRFGRTVAAPAKVREFSGRGVSATERVDVELTATGEAGDALRAVEVGQTVRVVGRLSPAPPDSGQAARIRILGPPQPVADAGPLDRAVNALRSGLVASTRASPPDQGGLLPSLVVGDTSRLPERVSDDFKATGLTHLTAVSGSNLVLVLGFVSAVVALIGVTGWAYRGVQLVTVAAFVVLCRAEPSVVRAAAMGVVALASLGRARDRRKGVRQLCVAVLALLLVDPWLARSWGFALSVAATAGLVVLAAPWSRALGWLPAWLAEAFAVPLAAQVATAPLVCALAGTVSLSGLAANLLAGPFVGPATVLGLLAALTSVIPGPMSLILGWLGGWSVAPLITIAHWGAALPGGQRTWPGDAGGVALLTLLCLLLVALTGRVLARPLLVLIVFALLVWSLLHPPRVPGWPGQWQAVFCNVGQGDATVLRAADREAVLVDTGPDPRALERCLTSLGIRSVGLVLITHYHDDHVAGLRWVLRRFHPGTVVLNGLNSPLVAAEQARREAESVGSQVVDAAAGQQYSAGQVRLDVLRSGAVSGGGPVDGPAASGAESSAENDSSTITRARVGDLDVLLPGDAEPSAQEQVVTSLARTGDEPVRSQVIKMPHHGSSRQDPEFWARSGATLAVASAGLNNAYGHPAPAALRLADRLGMRVVRTDLQGSVAVWRRGGTLDLSLAGAGA